jgi:Transposase IS66 family/Family of unknown function (DUF6444)
MIAVVSGVPADELAVVAELQGMVIGLLESRNADLEARNGELAGEVADLRERLARLERLVSRNSGSSSMPPSSDDLPGRKAPGQRKRGGSGNRPGKQPGAPGAHLAWREEPDDAQAVFPAGPCSCGRDLADAADLGVSGSRQVIEMPLAAARVVQYDSHAVECARGRVHEASPPADAGGAGTVTWGLNARALAVFLMVIHHVPVERCAGILESPSGIRPSGGFAHSLLARAAQAVRHVNMLIRALVITAGVICADETPIRVGPGPKTRKRYLLVACTNLLTCYFLGDRSWRRSTGSSSPTCPAPSCTTATRTTCATRHTAISPAEQAENGGDVSGSDALPEAERLNGNAAWQKTGSLCPGVRNGVPGDPRDMVKS